MVNEYLICKECGYTTKEIKKPGKYVCPQCQEEKEFFPFRFGCGSKPSEVYEK
ncbi:MAG: hypothetical protein ACOC1X_01160 [Promethearchaeota archaeon]